MGRPGTFKKGNPGGPGGKREGAGDKTKEEKARLQAHKEGFKEALERIREERGGILAEHYYKMALKDLATLRHAVDKVLPSPKQEIELGVKFVKVESFKPE